MKTVGLSILADLAKKHEALLDGYGLKDSTDWVLGGPSVRAVCALLEQVERLESKVWALEQEDRKERNVAEARRPLMRKVMRDHTVATLLKRISALENAKGAGNNPIPGA